MVTALSNAASMRPFRVSYTGDYLDEAGEQVIADLAFDLYGGTAVTTDFLRRQSPRPGDTAYWKNLYSLEVTPADVKSTEGIVIFRPWVKASSFAEGADDLVVIGRAGAGQSTKLREHKPHPVAPLSTGAKFRDRGFEGGRLRFNEALQVEWILFHHSSLSFQIAPSRRRTD